MSRQIICIHEQLVRGRCHGLSQDSKQAPFFFFRKPEIERHPADRQTAHLTDREM